MLRVWYIWLCIVFLFPLGAKATTLDVSRGVLDLRAWNFEEHPVITLKGNWQFFWGEYIKPEAFMSGEIEQKAELIPVPSAWNAPGLKKKYPSNGYATYYLKIILDNPDGPFSLNINPGGTSLVVFANGKICAKQGRVGLDKYSHVPSYKHQLSFFSNPVKEGDAYVYHVVVHVSNFSHTNGGLWDTIEFGKSKDIVSQFYNNIFWGILIAGLLFMIFIYHMFLFVLSRERINLVYSVLVFFVFIMSITNEGRYIYYAFPDLSFEVFIKLAYWSAFIFPVLMVYYFSKLYKAENKRIALVLLYAAYGIVFLAIALFPAALITKYVSFFAILLAITVLYGVFHVLGLAVIRKRKAASLNLFAVLIILLTGVNDMLFMMEIIHTNYILHYGIFIFIIIQEFSLLQDSVQDKKDSQRLSIELGELNRNLEYQVKERTTELAMQNETLQEQTDVLNITNQELNDLQEYQQKLTHMLVHDLKAPIGTILNLTEYVKNPDEKMMQVIRDSSSRMQMLVLNILDIQKLEHAEIDVDLFSIRLKDIVDLSIQRFSFQADVKRLTVENNIALNEICIADEKLLSRVIDNLLDNAIKYTGKDGNVFFDSEKIILNSAPGIRLIISDNGPGISNNVKDKIFESYMSGKSRSDEFSSHGLGLAFCKMAVEAMDGEIGFSTIEGEGTQFFIDLHKVEFH